MESQIHFFSSYPHIIGAIVSFPIIVFICTALYNVFLHPLRNIPGPKINAISRLPYIRHHLDGTVAQYLKALHEKYGEVVRYSPTELSFISQESAWSDIYGFRTGKMKGHANTNKDPMWFAGPVNGTPSLITANDADHARGRRVLAHAFSDKALSAQENLLHRYGDQLVNGLRETIAASPEPVNMVKWYNWTTFDVIADLAFGEPFGCLREKRTHKFVELLLSSITAAPLLYVKRTYPWLKVLGNLIVDQRKINSRIEFNKWVETQTKARMERETDRPDFMTYIMQHNTNPAKGLSDKEITSNAGLLLIAGTETTATMLSGTTYLLARNPEVYAKLKSEIRSRWSSYDDITVESASHAPYLAAVIHESLRYFPPVPTGFNRVIPSGGEIVSGHFIPEKTSVCMSQHAAYHSTRNFADPESFVPERWMGTDAKYAGDKLSWVQPFSYGPRNCLGKNLAYAEMRLFLAKMVWSFDFELDAGSENWMERNLIKLLWYKPDLMVKVTEVERD